MQLRTETIQCVLCMLPRLQRSLTSVPFTIRVFNSSCWSAADVNRMRKCAYFLSFTAWNWYAKSRLTSVVMLARTWCRQPRNTILLPVVIAEAFFQGKTSATKSKQLIKEADRLFDAEEFPALYELLASHQADGSDEILWRLARASYKMSLQQLCAEEKHKFREEGLQHVLKALEMNEENGYAHKWYAIILNAIASTKGKKQTLLSAPEVRKHIDRAIELNPTDATSLYMLGQWCYAFAELTWYERKIAGAIYATVPEASFEEALKYFEKAEQVTPGFYSMNLLYLGRTHLKMHNMQKAEEFLKRVVNYPCKTADDEEARKEALALLKKMGIDN